MKRYFYMVLACFTIFSMGCTQTELAYLQKDYPFKDHGVVISSCPSNIKVTVNDIACITPCKILLPYNTESIKLQYKDKTSYVQVSRSNLHGRELYGTLLILNADNIGGKSDSPDAPYFFRDLELPLSQVCGAHE